MTTSGALVRLILLGALAVGCSKSSADTKPEPGGKGGKGGARKLEYPVEVAPLALKQVQYTVTAPGTIEAFQQVQITARVAGAVDKVAFTEGQVVKAGQVLATIEAARYIVAVGQAKAALSKAEANEKDMEAQLERRQGAAESHPGLIPGEEIATKATGVETAKADVEVAKEALHVAQLNLHDSSVRAPIAGVVQTRTVQTGQYLSPGAVLATILQRDPLLLRFEVTESEAPRVKPDMVAKFFLRETPREYTSKIRLVAGNADPDTRLVPVTADVDKTEHQYWLRPGAFAKVIVPIGAARQAIVVPTTATQATENGTIAYVVEKNVARVRSIAIGMHTPEGGVEVTRGLNPGDMLIVRGLEPLSDGAPVKVTGQTTVEAIEQNDAGTADSSAPAAAADSGAPPAPADSSGAPREHRRQKADK